MKYVITMIRHAKSRSNTGELQPHLVGDANIDLCAAGHEEAVELGKKLGAKFLSTATVFCSTYLRTEQTLDGILSGAGLKREDLKHLVFDDRLVEIDLGDQDYESQQESRRKIGWFWYRYKNGESAATVLYRVESFLQDMKAFVRKKTQGKKNEQVKHIVIITHGMTVRCIIKALLKLSIEQFELMRNPRNCAVMKVSEKRKLEKLGLEIQFTHENLAVAGLRLRKELRSERYTKGEVES